MLAPAIWIHAYENNDEYKNRIDPGFALQPIGAVAVIPRRICHSAGNFLGYPGTANSAHSAIEAGLYPEHPAH